MGNFFPTGDWSFKTNNFFAKFRCIWTIYLLAPYVFQKALTLRVARTVDPTRLDANTQLDSMERQDNRW